MLTEGQILEGKYRVERLLSKGGMGAVFVGEHTHIKRKVAIKVLHEGSGASGEAMRRFEKEAQAAGQIGSDHIVEVLDLGTTPEGDRFMVMEFLDGETLTDRIKKGGRLAPADAVPLVSQLLEGLAAAHAAGIVHRDLKPDNVFILKEKAGRRDFVKIVDFGVSKFNSLDAGAGQMTKDGAVMGTPYYMSPEQARSANEADARSDLYSVGVILYEAVTGIVPFQASTFTDLLFKIVFEQPPHPNSIVPDLDRDFATLVMTTMARDPAVRFQSARDLQAALQRWLEARGGGRDAAFAIANRAPMTSGLVTPPATGAAMGASAAAPGGHGSTQAWSPSQSGASSAAFSSGGSGFDGEGQPTRPHVVGSGHQPPAGAPPAPPAMGVDTQGAWPAAGASTRSRTGGLLAAALAAVGLGAAAAFFLWSSGKTTSAGEIPAASATASAAAPTATALAAVEPAPLTTAQPAPTASELPASVAAPGPSTATAPTPPTGTPGGASVPRPSPPPRSGSPASTAPPGGAKPASTPAGAKPASTVKDFGY